MRNKLVKGSKLECVETHMHADKERESCFSCGQIFEEDAFILAAYGLLFCSIDCALERFPDADLDDIEILLASDIGVK